jgi:hypothetical protein
MLATHYLRTLTIAPQAHPRGERHVSAASGLVCANGRAYVICDDEHHLAVFCDDETPGELHRVLPGDLPRPKPARKRLKPDLETLLWLPPFGPSAKAALLALGSGSRPNRNAGVLVPLAADGQPLPDVRRFDLTPLYEPLTAELGEINIEAAMIVGDELVLLNRGVVGRSDNAAARFPLQALLGVIDGSRSAVAPTSIRRYHLGALAGVKLGFTDAAALPDGGWVFSAVAEDTADSYADGHCRGSAVGVVTVGGDIRSIHRLEPAAKVEGIAVRMDEGGMVLCMVTDTDDPAQASSMLIARLPLEHGLDVA